MAEGKDEQKTSEAPPSYSDSIKNIGDQAPKLVSLIQDSIKGVAEALLCVEKIVGESMDAATPEISMRLEELRTFLADVVLKCRSYCKGCRDLGEYASDKSLIREICADLNNGRLNELKDFLAEIEEFLKVCVTRFERVDKAGDIASTEIRDTGRKFGEQKKDAVNKLRNEEIAVGTLASAGGGAISGGALLTILNPAIGIGIIFAGITVQATAVGMLIGAGYTRKQAEIFSEACKATIALDKNLAKVMHLAQDMRSVISDIKESAGGMDRLKAKTAAAAADRRQQGVKDYDYVHTGFCCFGAPRHGTTARMRKEKDEDTIKNHIKKLQRPVENLSKKMEELKEESQILIDQIRNVRVHV